jgi:hypothetical protein
MIFYLPVFLSFKYELLVVYVWHSVSIVQEENLKEGKKGIIIQRAPRGGNSIAVKLLKYNIFSVCSVVKF